MLKLRSTIILFIALLFSTAAFADNETFQAGRDYQVLPESNSTAALNPKNKISVVEFFSYGCPACFHLDPDLEKWLAHKPHDVSFSRIPVEFESSWTILAKTYYILDQLNEAHKLTPAIFDAIHNQNLDLTNADAMADFLSQHGINKTTFLNDLQSSPTIDIRLGNGRKIINDFMIFQVPGLVIDGKYKVDPSFTGSDNQRLLDIVNYLIAKEALAKKLTHSKAAEA